MNKGLDKFTNETMDSGKDLSNKLKNSQTVNKLAGSMKELLLGLKVVSKKAAD